MEQMKKRKPKVRVKGNLLLWWGRLTKQELETIAFALAPTKRITATSDVIFFQDRKEVIDALLKAGAVALAHKLQSKCRRRRRPIP